MNTFRRSACAAVLLVTSALSADSLRAQSSLVPANHPVYSWLEMQRVNGRVPTYQDEVRPQSRATVLLLLRELAGDSLNLARSHRHLLRDFLNEFDTERLIANRLITRDFFRNFPGSVKDAIAARTDPVLYAGRTADSVFSGAFYLQIGLGDMRLSENGDTRSGYLTTKGFKAFVNTSFGLGFHAQAENAYINSNRELLARDEKLGSPFQYRAEKSDASSSYEAFVSYRRPYLEAHFGRGSIAMGPALTDPLIMRPDAPNISFLRFQIGTPKLNLVSLHGSLDADPFLSTAFYNGDSVTTRVSPNRWVGMHRLTWQPKKQLTLALHEMTVYGARGFDFDYVNPVNPQFLSQRDKGDRDNLFIGADIIVRPVAGTELFGSLLLDDIKRLGQLVKLDTSKLILAVGARQRLLQNVQLGASYTRSDPHMYTHWLQLNGWEQFGRPLGHTIGPNATEKALRITSWLPLRTRLVVGARYIKQGLNPVDVEGRVVKNVGGDLLNGLPNDYPGLFNGADLYNTRRIEVELETEIIRALNISLKLHDASVDGGQQLRSNRFVDFRLRYGF
ncbi:MAG: hypothetical protein H7Z40_16990 [Phycisphaerae bacterium]|nr:hypothetical protein [Gemmatimonadaceae bacterium]